MCISDRVELVLVEEAQAASPADPPMTAAEDLRKLRLVCLNSVPIQLAPLFKA